MEQSNHIWHFERIGGVNRVNLTSGKDLLALGQLDKKLWTALSCPVIGLEIDSKTLEYIDLDNDKRIRVPEILKAVEWITSVIKNPDNLLNRNIALPLSEIDDTKEGGKILLASARQILANLGKAEADHITVEDTSDTVKIFSGTKFNGDGIITELSTDDDKLKALIQTIISCSTAVSDRSGLPGVNEEMVNNFYAACEAFSSWQAKAANNKEEILPFGDTTSSALAVFNILEAKIEDYFLRCRLAAYDPLGTAVLNNTVGRFEAIAAHNLTEHMLEIAAFPLALIEAEKPLPLYHGLNPAYEASLDLFRILITEPLFAKKKESITIREWVLIKSTFDAYKYWLAEKAGASVESLGVEKIDLILSENKKEALYALIAADKALETEAQSIMMVDKMTRFYRDIFTLLNNFVSFHDFYSGTHKAIFQAGRLFIDQRSCDLCIKVNDISKHTSMAGLSGICLIYCECYSKVKNERMTIVAAFTDGDFDDIVPGRNAIFFDNDGLDWDATIIKIIENPISIKQAFWSPYRKFGRFINKQIEKFASDKEKAIDAKASEGIEKSAKQADEGLTKTIDSPQEIASAPVPSPVPPPFDIGKFVGIFAAIGLALGAIGSVLAAVLSGFLSLTWWKMPIALLGIMLAISGPSMILAWLKLRKRNLAPVLDANGWAINARLTINIIFGKTLTQLAVLPINSSINLIDPFKKKKMPLWVKFLILIAFLAGVAFVLWRLNIIKF